MQPRTLLLVDLGFEQQAGETKHGVEGRADLMTHDREELAFGAVGGLGVFLGGDELALDLFAVGYLDARDNDLMDRVVHRAGTQPGEIDQ